MTIFTDVHIAIWIFIRYAPGCCRMREAGFKTISVTNLPSQWQITSKLLAEFNLFAIRLPSTGSRTWTWAEYILRLLPKVRYVGEADWRSKIFALSLPHQKNLETIIPTLQWAGREDHDPDSRGAVKDVYLWAMDARGSGMLSFFIGLPVRRNKCCRQCNWDATFLWTSNGWNRRLDIN